MTPRDRAAGMIRAALADGPLTAGQIETTGKTAGLSVRTLRRAADDLGIVRTRDGVRIWWALPTPQTTGAGPGTALVPVTAPTGSQTGNLLVPVGAAPTDLREIEMSDETAEGPRYYAAMRDGLTVAGRVLRHGDVVELPAPGSDAYAATQGRDGVSWTDDLTDTAQIARWGVVHLRPCSAPVIAVPSANDPAPRVPVQPIRPTALPDPAGAFPRVRGTVEWSRPLVAGLGGDGPVQIVADRARG